ncbi:ATP-dependent helicase [Coprococcus comes]|uniref:ATP-dependent helicase n=1 Tax=Coprococcus comes TaxID=410072 RepID=UPI001899D4D3|nr:ATP-dependent helicase [Coprococcus comes]MDC0785289.1 ATP-dependent helicase [Coprococcus comes]MDC0789281.1 ATP-dependent helicase [Coprococcus comes]MDC0791932.1 ATP-dependent helicase [Coprococcus comes]MDC0795518.1 ATP-dependent helicase [Coprococcus comes]
MKLNRGQDEAIKHGNGPCMVLAPPGSGKTLIVTERTRYLIEESGVRPDQILVITFTRYAAREMKERFERLTAGKNYPVTFGTFHSIFYGILKCAYGIGANNLMSEKESSVLLQEVLDQTNIESTPEVEDEEELVRELLREVGMVKNGLYHLKDFHSKYLTQDEFAEVFRSYEHQKKELKKFDFDDMLVQCYALFRKKPEILQGWQKRFQYILIDEFQDINRVQYEVIRMLAAPRYNLFVVGDDDQSIYGFRGAKLELMLYMKQEFPSLRTISLTVNYRSTEFITGAAARVILHNDTRFYKRVQSFRGRGQNVHVQEVLDEQEEAQYVTEEIQKKLDQGIKPGEIAVLFRAAVQARMISEILSEHRIPFEMRDYVTNFYRHFIVKDMMAYLQLAAGKRDRSLFLTICNRPLRYLARNSMENRQVNFEDLRKFYCDKDWMLDIIDQFDVDVRMMKNMAPYAAIQYIRKKIGYDDFLKEYAEKHQISWKQLMDVMAELEERSKNFKSYDEWEIHIAKYTQELEEQQAKARKIKGERENKVQLMTIHSAKGLEFEDVFVIHANEGEIPHQKAEKKDEIEEERRLFYVALTRAKNNLCISYITQKNGNSIKPSRFVEELLGQRIK